MMMTTKILILLILFAITPTALVHARLGEEANSARRRQQEQADETTVETTLEVDDIFANKDMQNELMIATNCTGTPFPCAEFGRGGIEYCYTAADMASWTGCHWRWESNNDFGSGHCFGEPNPCSDYHADRLGCLMMGCTPIDDKKK
jgi:hypothetical protein